MRFAPLAYVISLVFLACAPTSDDGTSKRAAIDRANRALSKMDCSAAILAIDPIYRSELSDNDVRLVRASAYACQAGVNFFELLDDLSENSSKLASNEIWQLFTQFFPSNVLDAQDRVVEGAQGATDALLASIRGDMVLTDSALYDTDDYNPKSQAYGDRTTDSNVYLAFVSMAAIGGFHNRYGNPDPTTYKKGNILPWKTATTANMDTLGCQYASAIVNFADSLGGLAEAAKGEIASKLTTMSSTFQALIYSACDTGCKNEVGKVSGVNIPGWSQSGCTVSGGTCETCPLALRDRLSCTAKNSNIESCAAAGVVNFINTHPLGWQGP